MSVNGVEYRFEDGNTFLISSSGKTVRVLQMHLRDNRIMNLADLRKSNSEADEFFTQ